MADVGDRGIKARRVGLARQIPVSPPCPSEEDTDLHLGSQGRGFVGFFDIRGALYFS